MGLFWSSSEAVHSMQNNKSYLSANDITSVAVRIREEVKKSNGNKLPADAKFLNGAAHPLERKLGQYDNLFYSGDITHTERDKYIRYNIAVWSMIHWVKHKYLRQKGDKTWQNKYGDADTGYKQWLDDWWRKSPQQRVESNPQQDPDGRVEEEAGVLYSILQYACEALRTALLTTTLWGTVGSIAVTVVMQEWRRKEHVEKQEEVTPEDTREDTREDTSGEIAEDTPENTPEETAEETAAEIAEELPDKELVNNHHQQEWKQEEIGQYRLICELCFQSKQCMVS